jgi:hypothetical protein
LVAGVDLAVGFDPVVGFGFRARGGVALGLGVAGASEAADASTAGGIAGRAGRFSLRR